MSIKPVFRSAGRACCAQLLLALLLVAAYLGTGAPALHAQENMPGATVTAAVLNVRAGPGTSFVRVGAVKKDDRLALLGQANNCSWLHIRTPQEVDGWVSGRYVEMDVACSALDSTPGTTPAPMPAPTLVPTPDPTPIATTPAPDEPQAPGEAGQGCFLFENQLGPELTVTVTDPSTGKGETFKLAKTGDNEVRCYWPGRYNVTADAPPPWNSINFEVHAVASQFEPILFAARP